MPSRIGGILGSPVSPAMPTLNFQANLTWSSEEIIERFFSLKTRADLAELLQVPDDYLVYVLYIAPQRYPYRQFKIPKRRGGSRVISAPAWQVRMLQGKLNHALQVVYKRKPSAHGFIRERSILTNARPHAGKRFILNVDLKDFFPAINFGRVRGVFVARPFEVGHQAATVIAQICCHDNQLPQGAPSSPMVSNLVCARLDGELQALAKEHRCTYTRYADDITFSTTLPWFPRMLGEPGSDQRSSFEADLRRVISRNGFEINEAKFSLWPRNLRQEVTGLTVNDGVNVPRRFIRQLRAMLHAWRKFGYAAAETVFREQHARDGLSPSEEGVSFRRVVLGRLEFLRMVKGESDPVYRNLRGRLIEIEPGILAPLPERTSAELIAESVEYQKTPLLAPGQKSSTVTIMFTDIEGSTALNKKLGDLAWNAIRREHNEIIRQQIRLHHGWEVKTVGDSFMVSFTSAEQGIQCAISVQRALRAWNPPEKVNVRIGCTPAK